MIRSRLILMLLLAVCFAGSGISQTRTPMMSLESDNHDFGKINEADGQVTWKFVFTNTGAVPLVISNVSTSCGCTSPAWSREPVLPGAKGFVSATYDPRDRPGAFEKSITVTSNADPAVKVLKISGNVVSGQQSMEQQFMVKMGDLKMKTNHFGFGKIALGTQKTIEIPVFNSGTSILKIGFSEVPAHIKLIAKPASLKPGEIGIISATYDSKLKGAWGFVTDRVPLLLNDKSPQNNNITVSATLNEDFSGMTEKELAEAPVISFINENYDFGQVKEGSVVSYDFEYTNKGKSDLIIHKVSASCGCTSVSQDLTVVKPGAKGKISIKFNSEGRTGEQNKTITVVTNDPKNPQTTLWLKGVVTK